MDREKKNKRTGMIVSVSIHLSLLIIFFFLLAWREPNPPLPEYGVEINFGLVDAGSGEEATPEPTSEESSSEEVTEPVEEEVQEEVSEETAEEVVEEEITEPVTTESEVVTTPAESPDVREESKETKEETPKEEEPEVKQNPVEETKEEKKEESNPAALYKKPDSGETGSEGEGDDTDAAGDKGDPKGLEDAALYKGTPGGGGGGPRLELQGWIWDEEPDKVDPSNEEGFVTFRFGIDSRGDVEFVQVQQKTVSSTVAKFYQNQLENTTFKQKNPSVQPEPTVGTVTFVIKSK